MNLRTRHAPEGSSRAGETVAAAAAERLHAAGNRSRFRADGPAAGLPLALPGGGELGGGFLIAAGLVTPLGTALLAAVMTVAILVVHLRRDIWAAAGGSSFRS
jgi:uncharacterized membrane protein YphA (DoxX/SURF4 family)